MYPDSRKRSKAVLEERPVWDLRDRDGHEYRANVKLFSETIPVGSGYAQEVARRMSERLTGEYAAIATYPKGGRVTYVYSAGQLVRTER